MVLQKPTDYRTNSDIKLLAKTTENIKFFQEINQDNGFEMHNELCKYMVHKFHHKDDIVFQEGGIGTTFYIIIKGSVSVWKSEDKNEAIMHEKNRMSSTFRKSNTMGNFLNPFPESPNRGENFHFNHELKKNSTVEVHKKLSKIRNFLLSKMGPFENDVSENNKVLTEIRVLSVGDSFGELSLIENKPRAATIKCRENCHFAVLDKQFFIHILSLASFFFFNYIFKIKRKSNKRSYFNTLTFSPA